MNLASECWSWAVNPVLTLSFLYLCKAGGGAGELYTIMHLNSKLSWINGVGIVKQEVIWRGNVELDVETILWRRKSPAYQGNSKREELESR